MGSFYKYERMPPDLHDEILTRITPSIRKQYTRFLEPLSPGLRLAITLRYLASEDNYPSLSHAFRCSRSSICHIIPEVCRAIVENYKAEVASCPVTTAAWKAVAEQFERK